jgi:lysophospholipase L1-like esterase
MSYTKEKFYTVSQESQPQIVLIMLGTNDTVPLNWNAERYERDLEAFVDTYKGLESAPAVYLLKSPPIYNQNISHNPSVLENEVLPIIERVAEKTGVGTVDVFAALSGKGDLFPDGLHPNAEGAAIIAETVYGVIG